MNERQQTWKTILDLFWSFCKIGPVTFGGGYAMIPQIEREAVQLRHWMNEQEVVELLAVSGAAPGAIGVNAALCIGYRVAGVRGAIAAFLGVLLPTFFIVLGLSSTYLLFKGDHKVAAAFEGIRPAIVALIIYAAIRVGKSSIVDRSTAVIAGVCLLVLLVFPISPIWAMLASPLIGIGVTRVKRGKSDHGNGHNVEPVKYVDSDYFIGDGI